MSEKHIFELTDTDATAFDRLLTEVFEEATRREKYNVSFWERMLEEDTNRDKKYAKDKLTAAEEKLERAFHREAMWVTSSQIRCEEPNCPRHRALFVGIA